MTESLYIPEKPKLNTFQKILGYGGLTVILVFFFVLIIGSFAFNKFGENSFQEMSILSVSGFALVQVLLFYFFLKKDSTQKKHFDSNLNTGGVNIPKPLSSLTDEQKRALTRMHSYSYSMHKSFWFLIPIFILFDGFVGYTIVLHGINIMSFMLVVITLGLQGAMIQYGRRHYLYYLDLINPVFHTTGECVIAKSNRSISHITVNGVIFPLNYHQDFKITNKARKIKSGEVLEIIYSPHSKHIWEIKTIGKKSV